MAQLEIVSPVPPRSVEQDWTDRETQFLGEIDSNVDWYQTRGTNARRMHRSLGVIVLICAVLAPVTVVSGAGTAVSPPVASALNAISVAITLIIAFAEGLRRNFRYEERWIACSTSRDQLKRLREDYLDQQVGKPVGSEGWVENFLKARREAQGVVMSETKQFFDVVRQDGNKSGNASQN